jgi:hypothetical protein
MYFSKASNRVGIVASPKIVVDVYVEANTTGDSFLRGEAEHLLYEFPNLGNRDSFRHESIEASYRAIDRLKSDFLIILGSCNDAKSKSGIVFTYSVAFHWARAFSRSGTAEIGT